MIIRGKNYRDGNFILGADATLHRGDAIWVSLDGVGGVNADNRLDGLKSPQLFTGKHKTGDDFVLEQHWGEPAYILAWHFTGDGVIWPEKYAISDRFVLEEGATYEYDIATGKVTKVETGKSTIAKWLPWLPWEGPPLPQGFFPGWNMPKKA